ncbi:MAG: thiamine diphosphokinase [Bacteroidales bacterium]|nr:thiamine diphosphokinase [Bacteroidales bacterium]
MSSNTIILADGSFPEHEIPLGYLTNAERIICCDGSAENLLKTGIIPEAIVGDMDSLKKGIAKRFSDRIYRDKSQETNDLTKAVKWCVMRGFKEIIILGATGKREDHTVGNISLLAEYVKDADVVMVTDTGIIRPFRESCKVSSYPGQQVSIFSIDPANEITSKGLKFPLKNRKIENWWVATLNEAVGKSFSLEFKGGPVIVYLEFPGQVL